MSEETQDDFDFGALVTWFIENGVFVIGAFVLFAKTSDLMTKFAPSEFMGYTDIASLYGFVVACMVEGAFVGMKLALGRPRNVLAWVSNVILIIAPFGVSALAQVFDSFITQDTLAQQTPEIQFFATWFIPSIPTLIVALFLGKAILESMASGVPLVTTRVGQAMDLVKHGENAFMTAVEDVDALASYALQVYRSPQADLKLMLDSGRKTAEANSYESQIPLWAEFMKGFVE